MAQVIRFEKAGFRFEVEVEGLDRYGALVVRGSVHGQQFTGRYHETMGRRAIEFWRPVTLSGRKVGGVEPVGAAKAELDRLLEAGRAEQAAAVAAYEAAQPPAYRVGFDPDRLRIWVLAAGIERPSILPDGTRNAAASEAEARLNRAVARNVGLWRRIAELEVPAEGQGRIVPAEVLEAVLAELEVPAETDEAEAPEAPETPETTTDPRPAVHLRRCWECGRVEVVSVPEGYERRQVEQWLADAVRRRVEAARAALEAQGQPPILAAAPAPLDEGLPVRFAVVATWYCGC